MASYKDQITIEKVDETWFRIDGPEHFCHALSDHFTFEVENLHFMKKKSPKLKYWDGKKRLYKRQKRLLPYGLIQPALEWMSSNNHINIDVIQTPKVPAVKFSEETFLRCVKQAKEDNPNFVLAEDQYYAVKHCLQERHCILVSPTSSGKSFIIFCLQEHIQKRMLIVVPTIQLTHQMEKDFRRYGFKGNIHKLYYEQERPFELEDNEVVIATWQTLRLLPDYFFKQFETLIGDEVHELQTSSGESIVQACNMAYYKIGTTGSLKNPQMHKLALQGLFGPIVQFITTKELMDQKRVAQLKVRIVVFKYSEEDRKEFWRGEQNYNNELAYLFAHEKRNRAIAKLALSLDKNTLIMFKRNAYGLDLYTRLGLDSNHNKQLFHVDGTIDLEERQDLVEYFEANDNGLGVVSFGTFQRGISIHNLHNLIFAVPNKSETTTVQSIGRLLRLHTEKDIAILWDIADDIAYNGKTNISLDHLYSRMQEYSAAGFDVEFISIDL